MPYTFTPTHTPNEVKLHADMKTFREWAKNNLGDGVIVHGTSVNDGENEYGKLRYVKPAGTPPTFVQPDVDGPSLDDVLADIDRLELDDAQLIEDMDGDEEDFEDEVADDEDLDDPEHPESDPVYEDVTPRFARMSHKDCGHATTGEAGKIARAECRARHRASVAA